jgi:hypothetical protein
MDATRRRVLTSMASAVAGVGSISQAATSLASPDTINTHIKQKESDNNDMIHNPSAYLATPSMCFTTLFTHLPTLLNNRRQQPIIIMDEHDIQRLHGRVVRERGNRELQIRGAICDALRRRGILTTIDYARYYPATKQDHNLQHCRELLASLPDHVNQQAARRSSEIYTRFHHGDYQQPFRSALGTWERSLDHRNQIVNYRQKLERGGGDPIGWNERVFGKYMAALEVRYRANQALNYNIVGVLGQGDQEGFSTILHAADGEFDNDMVALDSSGQSIKQIGRPDPDRTATFHDLFETVARTARETTGTQHDDWYVLGSRFAAPLFPDLFTRLNGLNGIHQDIETVVAETDKILTHLDKEAATNRPAHLQYDAERIAEHHEQAPYTTNEIMDQLGTAANLANHSADLREIADSGIFSPASVFVAASIKMDPHHRYTRDEIYRRAVTLQRRLRPVTVPDPEIEGFRNRGGFRTGGKRRNWYQRQNRTRKPAIHSH